MTRPLYAIGRFCSRHHYPVIAAWILLAVALVVLGQASGDKTSENLTLPGTGSTRATELLEDNLPEQAYGSNPLVLEARSGQADRSEVRRSSRRNRRRAWKRCPKSTRRSARVSPAGAAFLSEDEKIGYIPVILGDRARGNRRRGGAADPRRRRPGARRRPGDRGRQLRRPAALQALDRAERGDRPHRRGDHPALRLRHRDGDDAADRLRRGRPRLRALDHPPARARGPDPGRRLDSGDDDRPRGRDRLRALHRHPPQTAAAGWDGAARVDRPRNRDRRRRRRLRRLHGGDRALLARLRRNPAGRDPRLHRGDRGRDRGLPRRRRCCRRCWARSGRTSTRCASSIGKTHPDDRKPHGWLRWAERVVPDALALGDRGADRARASSPCRSSSSNWARTTSARCPRNTTSRQAYEALNTGFGPGVNGPLLVASEFNTPDRSQAGAAGAGEGDRRRRRRRRGDRTDLSTTRERCASSR